MFYTKTEHLFLKLVIGVDCVCCSSHVEDFVKKFYSKIGIVEPQQLDFQTIAERLGIHVFYWTKPSEALFLKNYAYIFLNENLTEQQKWQDFCHEVAHVLLHAGNQSSMSPLFRDYQEWKANNFMYHACMPTFMLDQVKVKDYTPQTVIQLSVIFHVEYEFALKRLKQYIQNKSFMQDPHGVQQ